MESVEKDVLPPDWHCYSCDARVAQFSIGYSDPTEEPQCSRCGRFGFLEPVHPSDGPLNTTSSQNDTSNSFPLFLTAEISAVALPFELPVTRPARDQDGFRITFDGCNLPLHRESLPIDAPSSSQRTETQIIAFDLLRPGATQDANPSSSTTLEQQMLELYNEVMENTELLDDITVNSVYHDIFGLDNNTESRATYMQAVADLPRKVLFDASIDGPCAICQEDFKIGDTVTPLCPDNSQCAHTFHSSCIVPWLREHNSCPVCRYELPADAEEYERRKKARVGSSAVELVGVVRDPSASSSSRHSST